MVHLKTMLANIVLPSFLPHSVATLVGLFVIAAIEGWFLMRLLKLRFADSYRHSLVANLMSTFAGIPLAWLLWTIGVTPVMLGLSALGIEPHPAVESTLWQSAIVRGIPTEWTHVGGAAAWIVLLVPFWFGSVWIERRTLRKRLPGCDPSRLSKAVVRGNLATYSVFLVLGLNGLSNALADLPHQKALYEERRERSLYPWDERGRSMRPAPAVEEGAE